MDSGRRAVYATAGVLVVAFAILEAAFIRSDFTFALVASHSSSTTPAFYRVTAVWSSQEGSLLLWVLLLSLWRSAILFLTRRRLRDVAPYATAVLLGFGAFFCGLLVFLESPSRRSRSRRPRAAGLNPLLRHPSMMIHPPMLYSGYTLFAVPFAFAVGALVTRQLGPEWIRRTRPFTLAAWFFLGIGIILGARWSYSELGWGGYWAWDPVENASLMPWLTGTAFLHSVMIQEKRGMLKVWNVSLVLATGVLAILGTFLVRSGILESIHAFGASTLGVPFLLLIVLMIGGSIALVVSPLGGAAHEHRLDSLLSREAAFLLNNLVLVSPLLRRLLGDLLPAHLRGADGRAGVRRPALVQPLHRAAGPRARAAVGHRPADRVAPGHRGQPAADVRRARSASRSPCSRGWWPRGHGVGPRPAHVLLRRLRVRRRGAGAVSAACARGGRCRATRSRRRPWRSCAATGGAGAATRCTRASRRCSWASRPRRPSRRRSRVRAAAGGGGAGGRRTVRYVRPTSELVAAANGRLERIDLGADLRVRRGDEPARPLTTSSRTSPPPIPRSARCRASSRGSRPRRWGCRRASGATCGPRSRPTPASCAIASTRAIASSGGAADLPEEQRSAFLGQALAGLARSYAQDPPPATFRIIASPMVSWIWIGALIVFAGGLIALWPAGAAARRPATAAGLARVARELRGA